MCKHILNAQVSVRAPCCKRWFDCPECHSESSDHRLLKVHEIVMACKLCRKVFRKDARVDTDESDEYCPYCDNHYVLPVMDYNIDAAEIMRQQQQEYERFNDPRMKPKFVELDAELEALLQSQ